MKRHTCSAHLVDALCYLSLRDVPEEHNGTDIWLKALVRTAKSDSSMGYAYMERDSKHVQGRIVKDFGSMASIVRIDKVYPFEILPEGYMPTFSSNKKSERVEFLESKGVNDENILSGNLRTLNDAVFVAVLKEYEEHKNYIR